MKHHQLQVVTVFTMFLFGSLECCLSGNNGGEHIENKELLEVKNLINSTSGFTQEELGLSIRKLSEPQRIAIFTLIWEKALLVESLQERKLLTGSIVLGIFDNSQPVRSQVKKMLLDFGVNDFSETEKQKLVTFLKSASVVKENILLAGIIDDQSLMQQYRNIIKGDIKEPGAGRWYGTPEWAFLLVLARKGDAEAARRVVEKVEEEKDAVIRVTCLLEDVAYTYSHEGINLLERYLESDVRLPSIKASVLGEPVYQRAAFLLDKVIEGFPINKKYYADYTDEDITICRKWIKENSKNLKFKNTK